MCLQCFQCSLHFKTSFPRITSQKSHPANTVISKVFSWQKFRVYSVLLWRHDKDGVRPGNGGKNNSIVKGLQALVGVCMSLPHLVVSLGRQGQLSLQDFSAFRTLKKGFFGGLAVFAVFMVSSGLCWHEKTRPQDTLKIKSFQSSLWRMQEQGKKL